MEQYKLKSKLRREAKEAVANFMHLCSMEAGQIDGEPKPSQKKALKKAQKLEKMRDQINKM